MNWSKNRDSRKRYEEKMKDFKKDKEVIAFIITVVIVIVFEASLTYKLYKENEQFQIYEESQMVLCQVLVQVKFGLFL